ncbi:MAG: indole-3-glycerol phosphate synthase TrpC [Rhodospirillaceae bacterium]|nr:indole-3-glycerol phosphate synthase TrpC [Rhodospirillaceae bacterium]
MSDTLAVICARKMLRVAQRKHEMTLSDVEAFARKASPVRGFAKALAAKANAGHYALIAEVKKASPSAGLIRADFEPRALAQAYERGGAACLSVLTEEDYFQGADQDLTNARSATSLPALRKDFMLDTYQVAESRAINADCILIILAAVDDALAAELEAAAFHYGMDVIIEVHDEAEFDRAMKLKSPLIGVNNRDLKTLQTDLATTERLAKRLPKDRVLIAESGLKSPADLARMQRCGAMRFLIGEALMRQANVELATRAILSMEPAHA